MTKKITLFLPALLICTSSILQAAALADDTASNAPYADGWQSSDNGGSGFGAWTLSTGGSGGHYIGTTGEGATSFGLFSGGNASGDFSTASRSLTGGALTAGQTFSIDLGNTGVDPTDPGEVGINLTDGGVAVWTLQFIGGGTDWVINDGGSNFGSGQGFAASTSLSLAFTYEGGSDYSYTFGSGSGSSFTATNTISGIDGFELFSSQQGSGENFGANDMIVIPEPSSIIMLGLTGLAAGGMTLLKRRTRS